MPLILKSKQLHVSNKPPSPDEKLFAYPIDLPNQSRIWRSYPQPDHISIVGWLRKEHFKGKVESPANHEEKVLQLATGLKWVQVQHASTPGYMPNDGKTGKMILKGGLELGERDSKVFVLIERIKTPNASETRYKLRLEFNPRKLGPEGAKKLYQILSSTVDTPFDFGWYLADSWLTRIDVAIDFSGLVPAEAILTCKSQGTTVKYNGADGALETIQLHLKKKMVESPKKKLLSPSGPLFVKLYDRNRERAAHGKPEPYHGYNVSRLERTIKKKNATQASFLLLENQTDPFKGVRFSLAGAICPAGVSTATWLSYCASRLAVGPKVTGSQVGDAELIGKMRTAFEGHPSNLLQGDYWNGWKKGIELTGLQILLAPAHVAHKSSQE